MTQESLIINAEVAKTSDGRYIGGLTLTLGSVKSQKGTYTHRITAPGKLLSWSTQDVPKWLLAHDGQTIQSVTLSCSISDSANGNWINKQVKILGVDSIVDADGKRHAPKL